MQIINNATIYIEQDGEQFKVAEGASVSYQTPSKTLSELFKSVKLAGLELTSN